MACDLTLQENKQEASDNVKFAVRQDGEGQHAFNLAGWCLSVHTQVIQRYGERKETRDQQNAHSHRGEIQGLNEDNHEH